MMCTNEVASIIIQLHILTGCDSVSGFFGHGKSSVYPKHANINEVKQLLANLGASQEVDSLLNSLIEKFVIKFIYNDSTSESLAECRAVKWKQMKKKTTSRLPPDPDSFHLHVKRANYQCYIFRHYMESSAPPIPYSYGWHINEQGLTIPTMFTKEAVPKDMEEMYEKLAEDEFSSDE